MQYWNISELELFVLLISWRVLQKRLAFIDMKRDHSQSGISEWEKKKKFTFWCHHVWTMCEHCCVNIHLWIASLNAFYPACPCTKQVYLHLHLHLHCHLYITICHHLWTMCEHYCVNIHLPIASFAFYPVCMYKASLSTSTCTTLPLACHHVWTMCEHYCVNIHLPIASLNALYPVCPCTKQVYLHLHLLHCHLHITMCHHLWTLCEHYCVNMHLPIASLNALYHACACTKQVYLHLHVLHYHLHVTMCEQCVNTTVWTSIYQLLL